MSGLAAYFDESGHADHPNSRFVGVGGLCAPTVAWETFRIQWQAVLDEHCGGRPFHMNEFSSLQEPFGSWTKKQRENFFGSLLNAIKQAEARPFGAVVSLDAYEYVCREIPGADQVLGKPYHLCFQDATRAAAVSLIGYSMKYADDLEKWMEFEKRESVAMVYSRQTEYGTISSPEGTRPENRGYSENLWQWIKEANPHFGKWMGRYSTASPNELPQLQAADLLVYELTHEFENRINRPGERMRWALAEMLPASWRNFLHKFYGVPQLIDMLIDTNQLNVTDAQRHAGSVNASMTGIMNGDLLIARMYERRNQNRS